jgi:hypothetical protein
VALVAEHCSRDERHCALEERQLVVVIVRRKSRVDADVSTSDEREATALPAIV